MKFSNLVRHGTVSKTACAGGVFLRRRTAILLIAFALPALWNAPEAKAQSQPFEMSVGWTYSDSDQSDGYASVNGYYGTITWDVRPNFGIALNHSASWGRYKGGALSQRIFLAGATCYLARPERSLRPFVQPLAGVTRVSYLGTVEHQPTWQITSGAELHLARGLALEVTPAGYSYNHSSVGSLHNFVAGLGLNYTFLRRRSRP